MSVYMDTTTCLSSARQRAKRTWKIMIQHIWSGNVSLLLCLTLCYKEIYRMSIVLKLSNPIWDEKLPLFHKIYIFISLSIWEAWILSLWLEYSHNTKALRWENKSLSEWECLSWNYGKGDFSRENVTRLGFIHIKAHFWLHNNAIVPALKQLWFSLRRNHSHPRKKKLWKEIYEKAI